jgi:hypothetical protein
MRGEQLDSGQMDGEPLNVERMTDAELAAMYRDRATLHISERRVCLHCGLPGRRCPEWVLAATWLIVHGHPLPPYVKREQPDS